jgi:rhamnogalacturonan acetylesterase
MKSFAIIPAFLAVTAVTAPTEELEKRATPTVYLVGDSTMALGGGGTGTQGRPISLAL